MQQADALKGSPVVEGPKSKDAEHRRALRAKAMERYETAERGSGLVVVVLEGHGDAGFRRLQEGPRDVLLIDLDTPES